jgi:lipopolysaccharide transport system permease protein
MSIGYQQPRVVRQGDLRLRIEFTARNRSGEPWPADQGFAFGYLMFDPETDTLVRDGPRALLPGVVPPEGETPLALAIDLPPEPGRYRIVVSPLREGVAWYSERGWPFLLLDAAVQGGRAEWKKPRIATARTLRRERRVRALGRLFTLPFRAIFANWGLVRSMVRRDILARYRGSFMGAFWTVLNPLLLMVTYFFVFGIVLEARFGNDQSRSGFALYFLAGMLPWLAFSEALARAPGVLWEHRNFVKKLLFPVETLPVNLTAAGLVTECIAAILLLGALLALRGAVPASALWLPALFVPQVLFTLGLCWFLAALGVFVRDLSQVMGFLLTLWFFLTPICYPEASLPAAIAPLLAKNPMSVLVREYRAVLLEGVSPSASGLGMLYALGAVTFLGGFAWFYKLRRWFADVL